MLFAIKWLSSKVVNDTICILLDITKTKCIAESVIYNIKKYFRVYNLFWYLFYIDTLWENAVLLSYLQANLAQETFSYIYHVNHNIIAVIFITLKNTKWHHSF